MSESYMDEFRDTFVKIGRKIKVESPCPNCNFHTIEEIEIIKTGAAYAANRSGGTDFQCPNCYYKWKHNGERKRPGLIIQNGKTDEKYTQYFARQLRGYLRERLHNLWLHERDPQRNQEPILSAAHDELMRIAEHVEREALTASRNGNIDEQMIDRFWHTYGDRLFDLAQFRDEDHARTNLVSDIQARIGFCQDLDNKLERWV